MPKNICRRTAYILTAALIVIAAVVATVLLVRRDPTSNHPSAVSPDDVESTNESIGVPPAQSLATDDTHVIRADHVAHAVPGRVYQVFDLDADGQELVRLDASRSHSHYYDPTTSTLGFIVSWIWFDDDARKIGQSSTPSHIFPLGTSRVFLKVTDDQGNTHQDSTNITVYPSTRPGAFCYYYQTQNSSSFTLSDNRAIGDKPFFGHEVDAIQFLSSADFPSQVITSSFQARCSFHLDLDDPTTTRFTVEHDTPIRMITPTEDGYQLIMESSTTTRKTTSAQFSFEKGLKPIELWFLRLPGSSPRLRLVQSPSPILHDLSTQLPLIYNLSPPNSTLEGGGLMKITGSGFWNDPQVYFGSDQQNFLPTDEERATTEELFLTLPEASTPGTVEVTIGNRYAGSNILPFKYADDALSPIKFEEQRLMRGGNNFSIKLITNVKYGPDHRLYLASLNSFVYSFSVAQDMTVSDTCMSDSLGVNRTVIGLAFNPADPEVALYASTSIFFWKNTKRDDEFLWANGQVTIVKPGHNDLCLGVLGPIISGLPVSNHDHGVNGLLFDDDGMLHINVGGATNAGVPAITVGGIEESPLSGANLYADVMNPDFNGDITYDSSDPGTARVTSGDVMVYQAGWRNSFELTLHSNGFMYATDNGANSEFGNRSTDCSGVGEPISPYHSDDRLGKVMKGKFAGHANRNRGRDDETECVWRNPYEEATDTFSPPIATFESSTDGIIEFTADIFGGQLKGDLIASKFSTNDKKDGGRVYRVQLDENGDSVGGTNSLFESSGLSVAMTPWGDLLMPLLYQESIMVLKAVYKEDKDAMLISVTPFRGPKDGGNEVLVTGTGFDTSTVAVFDGEACTEVRERSETSLKCKVPRGTAGKSVRVGIKLGNGDVRLSSGGSDYRYMRI